ncbi:MAG TPA: hypothetical protein VGR95_00645 [Thermoanaerobaculia bacterium]|jgi:hypothetical protein|nr:hypothetical protein [Thermoanaerobaculia bacterium]
MRRLLLLSVILLGARAALAVTCGGFSVVPADHVLVKYSAPLATGATHSVPAVSVMGTEVTVTRNVSGGSSTGESCVDDMADLGSLGAGRFNLTWNDNVDLTSRRSSFTFFVGAPATGTVDTTSVLPPALPGQSVRLEVNACSLSPAVAYLSGNDINISQFGAGSTCRLYVLDFGPLPAATYNVTTTRVDAMFSPPASSSFRFVVQQPAATSPCSDESSVTRTAQGTARLHYEHSTMGYSPTFGFPTVTDISKYVDPINPGAAWPVITVIQQVADTADSSKAATGATAICHGEDLDLGTPDEGFNEIRWYDQISVYGFNTGFRYSDFIAFRWVNGSVQCSTFPRAITPSPAYEGTIKLGVTFIGGFAFAVTSKVSGQTITLDLTPVPWEGPLPPSPPDWCSTYETNLTTLSAGEYTVIWRLLTPAGTPARPLTTAHLTVVKPTRQRATHH